MPHSAPIRPSIALAAFAERFVEGRRVLVIGNALSHFWEQLIERGARLVHVCDCDASRVAEAAAHNTSQNVSFAPFGGSGLAVRDGAFDVGFVENLTLFNDAAQTMHKLRRALGPRGVALVAAPNPDVEDGLIAGHVEGQRSLDYYSLYDLVHREFPVVRMAGQMPFVGYSVAELAPAEEPEPCIDAAFVPGGTEEPEWFVAIASHVDVAFDPFLVVQLPHDQLTKAGSERLLRDQLRAARSAERSAVERLSRIEAEQRRLAEVAQRHQKDVDLARQVRLLQEELERKESWILQLDARAATADARADEAEHELEELRAKAEATPKAEEQTVAAGLDWQKAIERLETDKCELVAQISALEERSAMERQRVVTERTEATSRGQQLASRVQDLEAQLQAQQGLAATRATSLENERAELELRATESKRRIEELQKERELDESSHSEEIARLEAQLRERSDRVRQLERDLERTEEFGAMIVRRLGRLEAAAATAAIEAVKIETANTETVTDAVRLSDVSMASAMTSESWTQGPTAAATATSTELSVEQASAWAAPGTNSVAPDTTATPTADAATGGDERRAQLEHLATLAARQQADLLAQGWRIEQLVDERNVLTKRLAQMAELAESLNLANDQLQKNQVLLAQVGSRIET